MLRLRKALPERATVVLRQVMPHLQHVAAHLLRRADDTDRSVAVLVGTVHALETRTHHLEDIGDRDLLLRREKELVIGRGIVGVRRVRRRRPGVVSPEGAVVGVVDALRRVRRVEIDDAFFLCLPFGEIVFNGERDEARRMHHVLGFVRVEFADVELIAEDGDLIL